MPFRVEEFHDLVRLLEQRPEWRAEIRRLVLTDELLALPEQLGKFQAQTEQRFEELAAAQKRTEERFAILEDRLAELAVEMAELTRKVAALSDHVAELKGSDLEAQYRIKAPAYFGRLLRRVHALSPDELVALVDGAVEAGRLSDDQAQEIYLADAIVRGRRRENGEDLYLVVEVSWGVGPEDVDRAAERAELLAKTGVATLPVVAGKTVTVPAARLARARKVWQVTDGGKVLSPD
jgi:hypothetical protein